jgi:iron-sulfur cluster assembly protein
MSTNCDNVQKVFVPVKEDASDKKTADPVTSIGITDKAAERIKHFCELQGHTANTHGLKITVVPDGCSGNSYTMDLGEINSSTDKKDKLFTHNGATVIVDRESYIFIIGSTVDYVETLLMSGFQLQNPNVKGSCSCGSSFRV